MLSFCHLLLLLQPFSAAAIRWHGQLYKASAKGSWLFSQCKSTITADLSAFKEELYVAKVEYGEIQGGQNSGGLTYTI